MVYQSTGILRELRNEASSGVLACSGPRSQTGTGRVQKGRKTYVAAERNGSVMKGGAFTLVLVAGLTPILVFALLVAGPTLGLVRWQPPVLWTTQFGVPGTYGPADGNGVTAVSATTTGLYAVGFAGRSPFNVNATTNYLFLNRYDLNGREVWSKHLPGTTGSAMNELDGISVGDNSVFITGSMNGSRFVQRDDLNGNTVWTNQVVGQHISVGSGEVFVGGGGGCFACGGNQLHAYDLDGNAVWNKTLVSVFSSTIYAGSGGIYVAGSGPGSPDAQAFVSKYDLNGTLLWTQRFDETGFTCSCYPTGLSGDSSGIYVSGSTSSAFPGHSLSRGSDAFVRKYDLNGNLLWTMQSGTPDLSDADTTQISVDPPGIYLLVTTFGTREFVMRYNSNGNYVWYAALEEGVGIFPPATISATNSIVYVGGATRDSRQAFITGLGQSSSLILFGLNPPFSFLLAGLLAAGVAISIFYLRRNWRKRVRRPPSTYDARLKTRSEPSFPIRKPA